MRKWREVRISQVKNFAWHRVRAFHKILTLRPDPGPN